jgi:hypothetical protein
MCRLTHITNHHISVALIIKRVDKVRSGEGWLRTPHSQAKNRSSVGTPGLASTGLTPLHDNATLATMFINRMKNIENIEKVR